MSREQLNALLTAVREDPDLQQQLSQGDRQQVLNGLLKAASDKGFEVSTDDFLAAGLTVEPNSSRLSDTELDTVNGAGMEIITTISGLPGKAPPPLNLSQLWALIGRQ